MNDADREDIYFAPVEIVDVGIGGGENYLIHDKQGHSGSIHMIGSIVKIHLIYEETEVCETLSSISSNFLYLTINGDTYLNRDCKIIIEHHWKKLK